VASLALRASVALDNCDELTQISWCDSWKISRRFQML
jgi:hypothetical protein